MEKVNFVKETLQKDPIPCHSHNSIIILMIHIHCECVCVCVDSAEQKGQHYLNSMQILPGLLKRTHSVLTEGIWNAHSLKFFGSPPKKFNLPLFYYKIM